MTQNLAAIDDSLGALGRTSSASAGSNFVTRSAAIRAETFLATSHPARAMRPTPAKQPKTISAMTGPDIPAASLEEATRTGCTPPANADPGGSNEVESVVEVLVSLLASAEEVVETTADRKSEVVEATSECERAARKTSESKLELDDVKVQVVDNVVTTEPEPEEVTVEDSEVDNEEVEEAENLGLDAD